MECKRAPEAVDEFWNASPELHDTLDVLILGWPGNAETIKRAFKNACYTSYMKGRRYEEGRIMQELREYVRQD